MKSALYRAESRHTAVRSLPLLNHSLWVISLLLLAQSTVYGRIQIEKMQRAFQARYYFGHCFYVGWPSCPCGRPAPAFPPDDFYGDLDNDPELAASLVADLAGKFFDPYDSPIWSNFTKTTSLE